MNFMRRSVASIGIALLMGKAPEPLWSPFATVPTSKSLGAKIVLLQLKRMFSALYGNLALAK